ncbi:MFS transporter [Actinoplanes cyaneus]|uniref:MFS transporter n=1 Tax=Actinoplanes cyaneus TaxID=52696 RepID=A0A919MCF8_9ACTN|nr:MFS transporter [Actinoplanes cyaneus]MCW2143875.1 putative arabinose efflux permease, MFS family [Actinoplanes cyaneus]GID70624.1 MFS transporter [Actinoplanes cyaneus]
MAPRPKLFVLALALAVDMLGSGLLLPVSLLYFTEVTGLRLSTVGPLLSLAALASLPVPVIVGHFADRTRPLSRVLAAQVLQGAAYAAYALVSGPVTLLVVAIVAAVGQRLFWSSFFSVVAGLAEPGEDGRVADRRFALAGMIQMGATGAGTLLGGLAVTYGWYQPVVYLNAVSFLLSAVLLLFVPRGALPSTTAEERGSYRTLLRDRQYLLLIAVNTIFALCSIFVAVAVPVYLIDGLSAPAWLVGPLLAINTVLLASGQRLAVRVVRPLSRTGSLVLAGGLWVGWALVYAAAVRVPAWALVPYLLAGMVLYAAADLIHAPISNALSSAAAPVAQRGRYLAIYQYTFAFANILAPSFFTILFGYGPSLPWLALALVAAAASAVTWTLRAPLAAREALSDGAASDQSRT